MSQFTTLAYGHSYPPALWIFDFFHPFLINSTSTLPLVWKEQPHCEDLVSEIPLHRIKERKRKEDLASFSYFRRIVFLLLVNFLKFFTTTFLKSLYMPLFILFFLCTVDLEISRTFFFIGKSNTLLRKTILIRTYYILL